MIDEIVRRTPFFLLVFARCFSLLVTLPLFSMRSVSRIAKLALAFYMAYFLMPLADFSSYSNFTNLFDSFNLIYVFLILGEVMIGVLMGFFVTIFFA
ncbi:MAG: flagellar biosynthetic protein FliR, partial [Treponema sp.]|nr:flagellar biosynthetic protein FliR [Treponema sp.]